MTAEKLDLRDDEFIEDTLRSKGYELIAARIRKQIEAGAAELINTLHEPDLTNEIRGRIIGLRLALSIPQMLAEESRGKAKK